MVIDIQEKIEDRVIDLIALGSEGRLIVFKPEKSEVGADITIERRGKYGDKQMSFQIISLVTPGKEDKFIKDFSQDKFKADAHFYLLFVCFDKIRQKISDYIWLIPSLQFNNLAQPIKQDGKNILRFEAPLDFKSKNKYSKFLIGSKGFGDSILKVMEKGGRFDFKEAEAENKNPRDSEEKAVDLEALKDFLCEARRNTFAANAIPDGNPRLSASSQLDFQRMNYLYRDVYFSGSKKFAGQEIVYLYSKPIWAMTYVGTQLGKLETNFLRESLLKLSEKCRLGEACEYEKRELKYQGQGEGNLRSFSGKEEIFLNNKSIYKLTYQGGLL